MRKIGVLSFVGLVALTTCGAGFDEPEWPVVATDYTDVATIDLGKDYTHEKLIDLMKDWQTPLASEVRMVNGSPEFFVNGEPRFMMWGTSSKYDNKGVPYSFVTVWNYSHVFNPKIGKWDFDFFDRQAYKNAKQFPGAMFIWQLQVYPSKDWGEKYPEDLMCDEKGERDEKYWNGVNVNYSFASDRARDYMIYQVTNAIAYLEKSPYANRIVAYRVASAQGVEWFCPPAKWKRIYDHSPHAKRKFKEWCRTHYPQLKDPEPPTWEDMHARDGGALTDGALLWDREKHLAASAFCEFYSEINERFMLDVVAAAKKAAGGRKAVGTYHGYTFFMNQNGQNQQAYVYDFKQALDSGLLTLVQSPNSYRQRRPGGSFADMKPYGTLHMNGIMSVCENDNRTSYGKCLPDGARFDQMPNQYLSQMLMRRDLSFELCRRNPLHHLTHPNSVYMDGVVEDLKMFRKLGDKLMEKGPPVRKAEIALVVSEKSITSIPRMPLECDNGERIQEYAADGTVKTVRPSNAILSGEIFNNQVDKWMRSGAPVDYLLAEDLENHPGDYKLYVFLYNMHYTESVRRAVAKLRNRGATILWTWAPGWSTGSRCGIDCMEDLTGIRFAQFGKPMDARVVKKDGKKMGQASPKVKPLFYPVTPCDEVLGTYDGSDKPGLAVFKQGKSTVFFSGTWQLDMDFIRQVIERAGVFTYVDSHDPIEANEKLFALHARYPGKKTVKLPQKVAAVYDVFGKKIIAEDADTFTFEAPLHSSWLFYLKPERSWWQRLTGR